jgi:hypothetical protein
MARAAWFLRLSTISQRQSTFFKRQEPEYSTAPPHSPSANMAAVRPQYRIFKSFEPLSRQAKKLLRKKKNESWAMRSVVAAVYDCRDKRDKSDSRVGGNLLCEIALYVLF